MDAAATPLPREETTPPVTNMYFGPIRIVPPGIPAGHWNWVQSSVKMSAYNAFYGQSAALSNTIEFDSMLAFSLAYPPARCFNRRRWRALNIAPSAGSTGAKRASPTAGSTSSKMASIPPRKK